MQLKQFFLILLVLVGAVANAEVPADFFSGVVPVSNRSQVAFRQGMNAALLQVLVKASAELPENIQKNKALQDDLRNAERFAAQFAYQPDASGTLNLQVSFPENIVVSLLKKAGLRYWSASRTPVLLMAVVSDAQGNRALADVSALGQNAVLASAIKVGLPVQAASGEQVPDLVAVVNMPYIQQQLALNQKTMAIIVQLPSVDAVNGKARWTFISDMQPVATDVIGDSVAAISDKGMAWLAQQMAAKDAVALSGGGVTLEWTIADVNTYAKFEKCTAYLKQLGMVDKLSVVAVKQSVLTVSMAIKSSQEALEKLITVDKKIIIETDAAGLKTYRWNE